MAISNPDRTGNEVHVVSSQLHNGCQNLNLWEIQLYWSLEDKELYCVKEQ